MSGRVVCVVGGSRGIGLACARRFQADGDHVAVTYVQSPPELSGRGEDLFALRCDVTDVGEIEEAFAAIEERFGTVEVLVVSAGITDDALLLRMGEERWERVVNTNLNGAYRVTKRAIAPMLKARAGRVVLISSVVAMLGNAGQSNYAATKAGLIGFGRSLAHEVAKRNVTVNIIAPGLVATDMLAALADEQTDQLAQNVPLGRIGTAEEIAHGVFFLASEEAGYMTGVVMAVDGGLGMGN